MATRKICDVCDRRDMDYIIEEKVRISPWDRIKLERWVHSYDICEDCWKTIKSMVRKKNGKKA